MSKPLILITNDDGIQSKGISVLTAIAQRIGNVVVAAPDSSYSGMSHAMTVNKPLVTKPDERFGESVRAFAIGGTPVDCVKLAVHELVPSRPDIILSGINHGSNVSSSEHYSGTIGAVREAALLGIRGVAFSLDDFDHDADFSYAEPVVAQVIEYFLKAENFRNVFFSVNIPKGEVRGIKPCRATLGHWLEDPHSFTAPDGSEYAWLFGKYINDEPSDNDTDVAWLNQGYATVTPCRIDVCDYDVLRQLNF